MKKISIRIILVLLAISLIIPMFFYPYYGVKFDAYVWISLPETTMMWAVARVVSLIIWVYLIINAVRMIIRSFSNADNLEEMIWKGLWKFLLCGIILFVLRIQDSEADKWGISYPYIGWYLMMASSIAGIIYLKNCYSKAKISRSTILLTAVILVMGLPVIKTNAILEESGFTAYLGIGYFLNIGLIAILYFLIDQFKNLANTGELWLSLILDITFVLTVVNIIRDIRGNGVIKILQIVLVAVNMISIIVLYRCFYTDAAALPGFYINIAVDAIYIIYGILSLFNKKVLNTGSADMGD